MQSQTRVIGGVGVAVEYMDVTKSTYVFPFTKDRFTPDEIAVVAQTLRDEGFNVFHESDLYIQYESVDI